MIDLHAHILPGLDDGAKNYQEAIETAKCSLANGITQIVATPHVIPGIYENKKEEIYKKVTELQEILANQGVGVQILPGAEYRLDFNLIKQLERGELLTLNDQKKYLLVDLPFYQIATHMDNTIFQLQLAGITPILAHPERNHIFVAQPEKLGFLIEKGVLIQVTAASLVGIFGKRVMRVTEFFLKRGWVHFMASDLHGLGSRLSVYQQAIKKLTKRIGPEKAYNILEVYPHLVISGGKVLSSRCFD